jgi:glycosyl transferase, family 25
MNPLTQLFGQAYVINLATRTDRRGEMTGELRKVGLSWEDPGVTLFAAARPSELKGFHTLGAHGCYLSHVGVLERAIAEGRDTVLILEDDCSFTSGFAVRLPALSAALHGADWSVFYGGCLFYGAQEPPVQPGREIVEVAPEQPLWTSHCMALRGEALRQLPGYLRAILARPSGHPDGGVMDVDGAYCWFRRQHPQFKTFVASPAFAYQRSSRTDVSPLKWHDRLPLVRDMARVGRRLRNRLRA